VVWVALDVASEEAAERWMEQLWPHRYYKVGLELFTGAGPAAVRRWTAAGYQIFLDLKLHDIPRTVGQAAAQAAGLGATLVTVHAAGGPAMVEAAVRACGSTTAVVAVTVLTSLDDAVLTRLGAPPAGEWAARLAALAMEAGASGLVTSAREVDVLAQRWPGARLVVPGIRLAGQDPGDQARVADPRTAWERGATDLVVGRAVMHAGDPKAALAAILEEVGPHRLD
jgi:orotidine-5'-phosphate decarboxylase